MHYIILLVLGALLSASTVHGSMITFTQTGRADGHFLEREYHNRAYTFTAVGDLTKVYSGGWWGHEYEGYQVDLFSASITVRGLGKVNLPDGYYSFTVSPLFPDRLHMNATGADSWLEFFLRSPVFSGWDLTTSIEPVSVEAEYGINHTHVGDEYAFYFRDTAVFSATVTPVPEPSTILCLATGLLSVLVFIRSGNRIKFC